jgi:UTP--glucose-1-phosphate uridylyltransferase
MKPLRKAIFPVAGMGTRFLPATKSVPKEMLTVVDRPVIDYAVREAVEAGCDTLIFITGRSKQAIANYFDRSPELEKELEEKNKTEALEIVRNIIPSHVNCIYIRQAEPLGLGHAVHCGSPLVHPDEYFAVLLPDDLIDGYQKGALQQMNEVHERTGSSVIALEQVSWDEVSQYGVVAPKNEHQIPIELAGIVEKPKREDAPSNWTVVGRYILNGKIMQLLETTQRGAGGEIQLTDGISELLKTESILGVPFSDKRFDCGSKAGFLEANLHFGLGLLKRGGR